MNDTNQKPIVFLAFANGYQSNINTLSKLPDELRRIRQALRQTGLCEVVERANATAEDIFGVFQDPQYRNRVAIFHYGGHASGYQLLLESAAGRALASDAGGFAAFLAQQRGLQLVFLNGCSTQPQTQDLLDANVSMVISTSRSIDDQVATDFACQFYQGLAGNASIRTAYEEAAAAVQTAKGGDLRSLYFGENDDQKQQSERDRWPWNLYLRPGSETADQWNLPDAADDPLAGLPSLPHQDLPEQPYRQLAWFERQHADLFFGRGHPIRDLYNQLTASRSAPIVLFYGQSGVGKSSLLDAGLIPRLEPNYEVRYYRRDQRLGLLGTLQLAIQNQPDACEMPLETAWLEQEKHLDKPLIVILDQVEEVYTRPHAEMSPDEELNEMLEALRATFTAVATRPRGKLIFGFRKEWLAELDEKLKAFQLPRKLVFLEPLSRRGIIEVVQGPARSQRLRDHYGLKVDDGLAEIIADDLLEDHDSAITPTLQILLTKMWETAKDESYQYPRFSRDLYYRLKRDGILLRDFLDRQIALFGEEFPEDVSSGLLLDMLSLHTTPLGTAGQCSVEQLQDQYAHLDALLPELLQKCQSLYLLTIPTGNQKESSKATRLAHDTLAPLIRERFDQSDKPGQRARRILDNRSVDWRSVDVVDAPECSQHKMGPVLDDADLTTVEKGLRGTRNLDNVEQRMLRGSREERTRRRRSRRRLVGAFVAMALVVLGSLVWVEVARENLARKNAELLNQTAVALLSPIGDLSAETTLEEVDSLTQLERASLLSIDRSDPLLRAEALKVTLQGVQDDRLVTRMEPLAIAMVGIDRDSRRDVIDTYFTGNDFGDMNQRLKLSLAAYLELGYPADGSEHGLHERVLIELATQIVNDCHSKHDAHFNESRRVLLSLLSSNPDVEMKIVSRLQEEYSRLTEHKPVRWLKLLKDVAMTQSIDVVMAEWEAARLQPDIHSPETEMICRIAVSAFPPASLISSQHHEQLNERTRFLIASETQKLNLTPNLFRILAGQFKQNRILGDSAIATRTLCKDEAERILDGARASPTDCDILSFIVPVLDPEDDVRFDCIQAMLATNDRPVTEATLRRLLGIELSDGQWATVVELANDWLLTSDTSAAPKFESSGEFSTAMAIARVMKSSPRGQDPNWEGNRWLRQCHEVAGSMLMTGAAQWWAEQSQLFAATFTRSARESVREVLSQGVQKLNQGNPIAACHLFAAVASLDDSMREPEFGEVEAPAQAIKTLVESPETFRILCNYAPKFANSDLLAESGKMDCINAFRRKYSKGFNSILTPEQTRILAAEYVLLATFVDGSHDLLIPVRERLRKQLEITEYPETFEITARAILGTCTV